MLINSVTFVLQETLEAALLISVLLSLNAEREGPIRWLVVGLAGGMALSLLYAVNMAEISVWFDYVGQEVTNAFLQTATTLFIGLYALSLNTSPSPHGSTNKWINMTASGGIASAITLEGSEIFVYLSGSFQQTTELQSVLMGSCIGFAIGLSVGALLFYFLRSLNSSMLRITALALLALFAGNMLSQSALQLTQADWIPSGQAVWDTSNWLSESSIAGRLLYALIGYEATPSLAQIISYISGGGMVLVLARLKKQTHPAADKSRPAVK